MILYKSSIKTKTILDHKNHKISIKISTESYKSKQILLVEFKESYKSATKKPNEGKNNNCTTQSGW